MPELPDIEEIEFSDGSVTDSLQSTESVLKRLLINLNAFKKIEDENKKLKVVLLKNQELLKKNFKKKLEELNANLKAKEQLAAKVQNNILQQYKIFTDKLSRKLDREQTKNKFLVKKYNELFSTATRIDEENKKMKLVLKKHKEITDKQFQKKIKDLLNKFEENKKIDQYNHKSLLKQHEEVKLELSKQLKVEKTRTEVLDRKYKEMMLAFKNLHKNNLELQEMNKKILKKLFFLARKSVANENVLEKKNEIVKQNFENKLKDVIKQQLNKEIEYKAKIDALNSDLRKYYDELLKSKKRYYSREKELKEKLKEILN
jgi:hypothetical protein